MSKNLTLRQVSDAIGISESYLCMIESRDRIPSVKVAQKIGEFLGFDWTLFYRIDMQETDGVVKTNE